jgi:DNA (cytosine-5)-methyltransferase 1
MTDHLFQLSDEFQVMPPLSDEEYEALKSDIAVNGVEDPIVHDEEMTVIDGHHRVRACRELGVDIETVPTQSVVGLSHQEKRNKAYKLNLQRRHLEHGQKSEIVDKYLLNDWDGDRSGEGDDSWQEVLAKGLGVSEGLIEVRFAELRSRDKFLNLKIFAKDTREQKVKEYIEDNPDASNRTVAENVEPNISYETVRNWRDEWEEDEEEDTTDTTETPEITTYGRASDADERVENTEKVVEATADKSSPESVTETAEEVAEKVNNGEMSPDEAQRQVRDKKNTESVSPPSEREDEITESDDLKVLNLYAGIGGNRDLWGDDIDVTAVEWDSEKADVYREHYPDDTVIETDAHEFLRENIFSDFDIIWSSPPCPTHSRTNHLTQPQNQEARYPDMELYQEIILLDYHADKRGFDYVVENVISYYDPLIEPYESGDHYFWSNFDIPEFKTESRNIMSDNDGRESHFDIEREQKRLGYDLSSFDISKTKKGKMLRNCVNPLLGKHVLQSALSDSSEEVIVNE